MPNTLRPCCCRRSASCPSPTAASRTRDAVGSRLVSRRMIDSRCSCRGPNISGCVPHGCVEDIKKGQARRLAPALSTKCGDQSNGVIVAVWLLTVPQALLVRTQNSCVVLIAGVVKLADVAFGIGVLLNPA